MKKVAFLLTRPRKLPLMIIDDPDNRVSTIFLPYWIR